MEKTETARDGDPRNFKSAALLLRVVFFVCQSDRHQSHVLESGTAPLRCHT